MNKTISWHPDEELMLRFADQDLSLAESQSVEDHISLCADCRDELTSLRETLGDFQRFHETVLKATLPDPPRPWGQPRWRELAKLDSELRVRRFPVKRLAATAALIAAGLVLALWLERPARVSAAELLRKAEAREQSASATGRRIRIQSRKHSWTRPAHLESRSRPEPGDAATLAAMLESAGFNWADPLSAAAFSTWRQRLATRHDVVTQSPEWFVVTTAAPSGPLTEASLTMRASDLHAVRATLKYRTDDEIDLTELENDASHNSISPASPATPESTSHVASGQDPAAALAEEVRVFRALHRIGADLGDPVEITRDEHGIVVIGAGLTAARQEQVRATLASLPGVRVSFESAGGKRLAGAGMLRARRAATDATNPLLEELRAAAGNGAPDPGDALIDASDRAMQRAYALAALARRFSASIESSLTATDRDTVYDIAGDHFEKLSDAVDDMSELLGSLFPPHDSVLEPPAEASWQQIAEQVLSVAKDFDQELNATGNGDLAARKARLSTMLGKLQVLSKGAQSRLQ